MDTLGQPPLQAALLRPLFDVMPHKGAKQMGRLQMALADGSGYLRRAGSNGI